MWYEVRLHPDDIPVIFDTLEEATEYALDQEIQVLVYKVDMYEGETYVGSN